MFIDVGPSIRHLHFAVGDARSNSDVDLLVEIGPGRTLLDLIALEQDLEELPGRRVDVLTDDGLSPHLPQQILAEGGAVKDERV